VYESDTAAALAGDDAWVVVSALIAPAEAAVVALHVLLVDGDHCPRLLQLLLVQLPRRLVHPLTRQVLHPKFNSTQLNDIEFFNFIIIFAFCGLE